MQAKSLLMMHTRIRGIKDPVLVSQFLHNPARHRIQDKKEKCTFTFAE